MNPTPPDPGSLLANLRQLKEMLDAGALTPQEYDTLKQRLIGEAASPAAGIAPAPPAPAVSATPASPLPATPPAAPSAPIAEAAPPTPYLDTPAALTPEATPLLAPEPDWLAAPAPALFVAGDGEGGPDPGTAEITERRNPLNLIFALGGLLLFLAVVAYLVYERRPDEHVSSQSQTAADSTAVAPEVGPQAEQLTLPPAAAPETVRVAPATPPPAAASATAGMDSTAAMPAAADPTRAPASVPATRPAPTTRPAPATTAPAADTTR